MNALRVLVRLPNWLGDVLMARPALWALRRGRPADRITLCGPASALDALAGEIGSLSDDTLGWPLAAGDLDALRSRRPGAAVVMPPSFSSAWFAFRAGADRRIGYRHEARGALLTRALARPSRGDRHQSEEYLALVAELDARAVEVPLLPVTEAARDAARRLAAGAAGAAGPDRAAPQGGEAPWAVLAPGAVYGPAKRWSASRFAAVAKVLAARGWAVLVCGTAAEAATCVQVAAEAGPGARSLAGSTRLDAQAALCAGARVVVCNDSGMAHLAAAVGAPTVAIFGSTSSAWTAPRGPRVRIVQRPPVCSPCFRRTCRIGTRCLEDVTVADVLAAVELAVSPLGVAGSA